MSTKNHDRAEGNTTLTISLPVAMKERLQELADAEDRKVSNFVRHHLEHRVMNAMQEDAPSYPAASKSNAPQSAEGLNVRTSKPFSIQKKPSKTRS